MKKAWLVLLLALAAATPAKAQFGNTTTIRFPGAPSGNCAPLSFGINSSNGDLYDCVTGAWVKVGTGGGGSGISIMANQIAGGSGANTIGPAGLWMFNGGSLSGLTCFAMDVSDSCGITMVNSDMSVAALSPGALNIAEPGGDTGLSYSMGQLELGTTGLHSGSLILLDSVSGQTAVLSGFQANAFSLNSSQFFTGNASNTDLAGTMTASTGTATYTFTRTYAHPATCIVQDNTTLAALLSKTVSTTVLTVTTSGMTDAVSYICVGHD